MKPIRYAKLALLVGSVLLIPLFGNLFVEGWNWNAGGFVFAGALFYGTGLAYEVMTRRSDVRAYRLAIGIAVTTCLGIVWGNFAAGIIAEDNPANVYYFAVIAIGIAGCAVSRLKASGLARTTFLMAVATLLVPVIAALNWPDEFPADLTRVFAVNGVIASLFVASGFCFRHASRGAIDGSPR